GQKALGVPRRLEPLHTIFTLPRRPVRVLAAIIEVAALPMFYSGQDLALGRAVALQLIRDDDPRDIPQALEQLAKELLRRVLIAPALNQDIEDVVVLVDSAPQGMPLPIDRQEDLVEVPLVPWLGASTLQLIGVVLPKLPTPLADGLMGHHDPTG